MFNVGAQEAMLLHWGGIQCLVEGVRLLGIVVVVAPFGLPTFSTTYITWLGTMGEAYEMICKLKPRDIG